MMGRKVKEKIQAMHIDLKLQHCPVFVGPVPEHFVYFLLCYDEPSKDLMNIICMWFSAEDTKQEWPSLFWGCL